MGLSSFFKNLFGSTKDSSANEIADQAETTFEQAKEVTLHILRKQKLL